MKNIFPLEKNAFVNIDHGYGSIYMVVYINLHVGYIYM